MPRIRILIVDDSVVMRRMIGEAFESNGALEVVGTAPNGHIALQKIPHVNPDVVTLDVDMPVMDGIATLCEIRKTYPNLPVIMFSTLTAKSAATTVEALSAGASDFVFKPFNAGSVSERRKWLETDLVPKIKALCRQPAYAIPHAPLRAHAPAVPIEIVCIGASTGGPKALGDVFRHFPGDFPLPIVIVQHMPPLFTASLAAWLNANTALKFAEGCEGELLEAGHVYIAPGGKHMEVVRKTGKNGIHLHDGPPENSCRPAVDVLFRSAACLYGAATLGVILTGMGSDGLRGCELIREQCGVVLAQDEATSVVWGMPGVVIQAGLADKVVPLDQMCGEIGRCVRASRQSFLKYSGVAPINN